MPDTAGGCTGERVEQRVDRLVNAILQRAAHGSRMTFGGVDDPIECLLVRGRAPVESTRVQQQPDGSKARFVVAGRLEVDLEEVARVRAAGVHYPDRAAVEHKAPVHGRMHGVPHRRPPGAGQRGTPGDHEKRHSACAAGAQQRCLAGLPVHLPDITYRVAERVEDGKGAPIHQLYGRWTPARARDECVRATAAGGGTPRRARQRPDRGRSRPVPVKRSRSRAASRGHRGSPCSPQRRPVQGAEDDLGLARPHHGSVQQTLDSCLQRGLLRVGFPTFQCRGFEGFAVEETRLHETSVSSHRKRADQIAFAHDRQVDRPSVSRDHIGPVRREMASGSLDCVRAPAVEKRGKIPARLGRPWMPPAGRNSNQDGQRSRVDRLGHTVAHCGDSNEQELGAAGAGALAPPTGIEWFHAEPRRASVKCCQHAAGRPTSSRHRAEPVERTQSREALALEACFIRQVAVRHDRKRRPARG